MWRVTLGLVAVMCMTNGQAQVRTRADEPLLNWSSWEQYRQGVAHPTGVYKSADVERARENLRRYAWARAYLGGLEGSAKAVLPKITPEYLVQMIPTDTPGDTLFTPCPSCRDLGKPAHPHGQWTWSVGDPDRLTCKVCAKVFPNADYPEDLVFKTKSGQTLSFYGGAPFNIFGFSGRPSFSAAIRSHKVNTMTGTCRRLAETYALTGDLAYARATKAILLRFTEVYPKWLVHVGYGEYADMDPHLAALNINKLPEDEITPVPAGPDRRLHSGYWQGGRATGTGMEAGFVRSMLEAYEFVCTARDGDQPLFSDAERLRIERDLILESTVLLIADKEVNNKSVGNATAVALVGMAMGHPEMVRFGLDVFMQTVDGWFLPDGGTSESFSYACMTLGGIESLGQAFRGYSDPAGYKDAEGKRIEKLDLYHDTSYKKVWQAMFNGLQGNLNYPPLADGHVSQSLGATFVELMADNYPENLQYRALLKELAGNDLSGGDRHTALYFRPPGFEETPTPSLTLDDYVYPVLRLGYLRSGQTGRDTCLVLSASDWGGHHHLDSLSLYYWQATGPRAGKEALSDLGYLWDHPMSNMTRRTLAHNTVIVDGKDQVTKGRGGEFTLFAPDGPVKVMEAQSQAYEAAKLYRRTVAQIEHAPGQQYVLDFFRVQGGQTHEYVFHGPGPEMTVEGPPLVDEETARQPMRFCVRLGLDEAGTEILVDDLSIVGPDGKEMAVNPSGAELDAKTGKPVAWGLYHGDGTEEWGQATEGRTDKISVSLKAIKAGNLNMNVALMLGASDGYIGPNAYQALPGKTYQVSFWLKGKAKAVRPSVLYWPKDPGDPANRAYLPLGGMSVLSAGKEWTRYSGKFTIPSGALDLQQIRFSTAEAPWRLNWKLAEDWEFAAVWPNEAGYTSLLGEGWGQRDYRNSDVGATLPYIVRRHAGEERPTVYVGAFETYRPGAPLVKAVRRLAVPEGEADNTVAAAVETTEGTDYVVSCLQARPVTINTPEGPLTVNGRFGAVMVREGKVSGAALVEGSSLQWNGQTVGGTGQ